MAHSLVNWLPPVPTPASWASSRSHAGSGCWARRRALPAAATVLLTASLQRRRTLVRVPIGRCCVLDEGALESHLQSDNYRDLEAKLNKTSRTALLRACYACGMGQEIRAYFHNSELVQALLLPENLDTALAFFLPPGADDPPQIPQQVMMDVLEDLSDVSRDELSIAALQHLQSPAAPQHSVVDELEAAARVQVEEGSSVTEPFSVRREETAKRLKALSKLKKGSARSGTVTGVSLLDGLRVDVGASVDALVPVRPGMPHPAELGDKVEIRLDEVYKGPNAEYRRFPLLAVMLGAGDEGPATTESEGVPSTSHALHLGKGLDTESLHEVRGDKSVAPSVEIAEILARVESQEDAVERELEAKEEEEDTKEETTEQKNKKADAATAASCRRPAPAEVLSVDNDGSPRFVPVPAELQEKESKVSKAAEKAWNRLAKEEMPLLSLELRCRDQLALDLEEVEVDVALGRTPVVPTALLGLARADDGITCVRPLPAGDTLQFQLLRFETSAEADEWMAEQQRIHAESWADPKERNEVRSSLARFFLCRGACHARGVLAVEQQSLKELRAGVGMDLDAEAELGGLVEALGEKDQEELAKQGGYAQDEMYDEMYNME